MGFSMLASIVGTIASPDLISNNKFFNISSLTEKINASLNLIILVLLFIFICRGVLSILINYLIIRFAANNEKLLKKRLLVMKDFSNFEDYNKMNANESTGEREKFLAKMDSLHL